MTRQVRILGMVLTGIALAALFAPTAQAKMTVTDKVGDKEVKLNIYGFSQFEARGGKGWELKGNASDGPFFQAQRIRVGFNYIHSGPIQGKLFLDFNQSHSSGEAGLPKMIKDAFVAYRNSNEFMVRMGMIKTPLGMDFTVPGWNLDIIERQGLEKGLVLERDFGVMVSGRLIGQDSFTDKPMKTGGLEMGTEKQGFGFGYDVGVFNPAGRSSSVMWDTAIRGDALCYVGRAHFDYGKKFHVEGAYGMSEKAAGLVIDDPLTTVVESSEDYKVFDVGAASELWDQGLELKVEYIKGENIRGEKDRKQDCIVGTAGFVFPEAEGFPTTEVVVKTYQAKSERGGNETKLGNTYIGLNFFPFEVTKKHRDLQRHKITLNYIIVNGDDVDSTTPWNGLSGYMDATYGVQWQFKY